MPREHDPAASLYDMLFAAERTLRLTHGKTRDDYAADEVLRLATERSIEIIGEAARRVPAAFQENHSQIAWRPIMATRHILAHDYDAVSDDVIWRIVADHLPTLVEQLRTLVPPAPKDFTD